jgi:aminodeoxychorismate lyase
MIYFNGKFVPEREAVVSVMDRGFLYGETLFETVRFYRRKPFLWKEHMARYTGGCEALQIERPLTGDEMLRVGMEVIARSGIQNGFLRLTTSRGVGRRGYSIEHSNDPTFCMTVHPLAPGTRKAFRVIIASNRIFTGDPFAGYKHGNKLPQILARMEADRAGANEALLLNEKGAVAEGSSSNLFWVERETLCTPPVSAGILPGTTREFVVRLARNLGIALREKNISAAELRKKQGVFLTSAGLEITPIDYLENVRIKRSPIVAKLRKDFLRHCE